MIKKWLIWIAIIAFIMVTISRCHAKNEQALKLEQQRTLYVGVYDGTGNFNPFYYDTSSDKEAVALLFSRLFYEAVDGTYMPEIATHWEASENNKTFTFYLNPSYVFSDGVPLTAHDIVFTYETLMSPEYSGRNGRFIQNLDTVTALDDHTVRFDFKTVHRENFANCNYWIAPKHFYQGDTEMITSEAVGSGPYKIAYYRDRAMTHLIKNPMYTQDDFAFDSIVLTVVEPTSEMVALFNGEVDLLPGQTSPLHFGQAKQSGLNTHVYDSHAFGYIKFNTANGPTADPEVRKALSHAVDREALIRHVFLDDVTDTLLATVQNHPFSPTSWFIQDGYYEEITGYVYNLEKAKKILDDANWHLNEAGKREKNGEALRLHILASSDYDLLDSLIPMWERDWRDALGIDLKIAYLEGHSVIDYILYRADENVGNWHAFFLENSHLEPDPNAIISSFHTDYIGNGQNNTSRYSNIDLDLKLEAAARVLSPPEAQSKYNEIAQIIHEDAVFLPLYSKKAFDLYGEKLTQFYTNSRYHWTDALRHAKPLFD